MYIYYIRFWNRLIYLEYWQNILELKTSSIRSPDLNKQTTPLSSNTLEMYLVRESTTQKTHVEALVLIDINGANILILNTRGRVMIDLINGKIIVKEIINLADSDM